MLKIKLSENTDVVYDIRAKLKENDDYCPCYIFKTEDTKCMCKEFRESKEEGYCHCGLYAKERSDL